MHIAFALVGTLVGAVVLSLIFLATSKSASHDSPPRRKRQSTHLVVVLGSGGHTEEMLSVLRRARLDFKRRYHRRTYIVSSGDAFSARKAAEFEQEIVQDQKHDDGAGTSGKKLEWERSCLQSDGDQCEGAVSGSLSGSSRSSSLSYVIVTIPRARKVHQSFLTTPLSTLRCLWSCLRVLQGEDAAHGGKPSRAASHAQQDPSTSSAATTIDYPGIILTNGPGTAVCVIAAAIILRLLNSSLPPRCLRWLGVRARPQTDAYRRATNDRYLRTIFVESWARVTTLSLSGRIVLPLADRFLVQWEGLGGRSSALGGRTEYAGTLVG